MSGNHQPTSEPRTLLQRCVRRICRNERGQTLVEFALVLPFMLLLIFSLVDFGRAFHTWLVVTNAAREGARVGATQGSQASVTTRINDSMGVLDLADLTITLTNVQGPRGEPVEVDLSYDFDFVTLIGDFMTLIGGGSLAEPTITSHASMRLE